MPWVLIDQMLAKGNDSKLYQALVQDKGYTSTVSGGINYLLGNMFDYNGPMLWTSSLIHDSTVKADDIIKEYDKAIADLENNVTQADVDLALIKKRSEVYDAIGGLGIGKVNLLACFALFDDKPNMVNDLEQNFRKVTPELIKKTIKEYLRPTNRTILIIDPKAPKK
jgi:predicted Zn-dependent peptidase